MAIFKARIRSITVYETDILVEGETKFEVIKYLTRSNEWHDDPTLDHDIAYTHTNSRAATGVIEEITSIKEIPQNWTANCFPWNTVEGIKLKDQLKD
jgi:hypothetical protein